MFKELKTKNTTKESHLGMKLVKCLGNSLKYWTAMFKEKK